MAEAAKSSSVSGSALKLPPQSLEAEQSVLGGVFRDDSALGRVLETRIEPDDFYRTAHGLIYRAMRDLFDRSEPVDLVTMSEELKRIGALEKVGGPAYLSELADSSGTAANIEHYAAIVRDRATLRRLITASSNIAEQCYDPTCEAPLVLDQAESTIFTIREGRDTQSLMPVSKLVTDTMSHINALMTRSGGITGIPTGYKDLDDMTGGFQKSDLIIIAGRPSMGKTALALNIAAQTALPQQRDVKEGQSFAVAFFSLEMSKEQVMMRFLCSLGNLDLRDVRTGKVRKDDHIKLTEAASRLWEAPIYIDDTPALSVLELRAKARRFKSQLQSEGTGLGMIVVDYLQLMRGRAHSDSREQEISEISRSLKALAKELNVPVVALSQLNRRVEDRPNKRPQLADLRESGAIEQDADVIAFVYREEFYKPDNEELRGKAELILGKQRNGPTGAISLTFVHKCARFRTSVYREEYL